MMKTIDQYKNILIVGLGKTGLSCAQHLANKNIAFTLNDSRENPPSLDELKATLPNQKIILGEFCEKSFLNADIIILSQGVSLQLPLLQKVKAKGTPIIGDIELFAQAANAKIVAITGSNAKSTVTSLVAKMAQDCGLSIKVGGNLGLPALCLLSRPAPDFYIVEVSNFQLETTYSMAADIACLLNITPDHLDRYACYEDYIQAKRRIYRNAKIQIYNREDKNTYPQAASVTFSFGTDQGKTDSEFGLDIKMHTLKQNASDLLALTDLKIAGTHNAQNALAALAIGTAMGLPLPGMLNSLKTFTGLAHRCQKIAEKDGVIWINDSKGTNVGATLAAILGIGQSAKGKIILLAGGVGKGADFSVLADAVQNYVKSLIVFGQDAEQLEKALNKSTKVQKACDLLQALIQAKSLAEQGDVILLSPACASFDMFKNFEHRGEEFTRMVMELINETSQRSYSSTAS